MNADVVIHYLNDVHIKVECNRGIAVEASEAFSFLVPGAKFHPLVKNRVWDGRIRLLNVNNMQMYCGLKNKLIEWCEANEYTVEDLTPTPKFNAIEYTAVNSIIPATLTPRDYQEAAVIHALQEDRALLLSPTSSGKSFIAYKIACYHNYFKRKVLIIVPTISLVSQLATDFYEYAGAQFPVKRITGGVDKENIEEWITVSTWQSIYKMPKKWFDQFQVVIGDEAHLFQAKALSSIMEKLTNCPYKIGMTGTLTGAKTHELVLQGLFGPIHKVTTTKDLMDQGHVTTLKIKAVVLNYSETNCQLHKKSTYPEEVSWLISYEPRNQFIKDMALSLKENQLILFNQIEHGKYLKELIQNATTRKVYFVYGGVDAEDREEIRRITEQSDDAIIVASFGTFSTGINIKKLHFVTFVHPTKSRIRTLQSIGRALRLHESKEEAILIDIADNLKYKARENYTLKHFRERVKFYDEEQFDYKIHTVKLN